MGPMNAEYVNRPRNYLAKRQKSVLWALFIIHGCVVLHDVTA